MLYDINNTYKWLDYKKKNIFMDTRNGIIWYAQNSNKVKNIHQLINLSLVDQYKRERSQQLMQTHKNVGKKKHRKKKTVIKTQKKKKKTTQEKKHKVYVRSIYLLTISQIWLVCRFLALYNIFLQNLIDSVVKPEIC